MLYPFGLPDVTLGLMRVRVVLALGFPVYFLGLVVLSFSFGLTVLFILCLLTSASVLLVAIFCFYLLRKLQ